MTLKGQMRFWQHRCYICIHLYPRGLKLSSFPCTTSGFQDRAYIYMRDLDVILSWPWKVKCDFGSIDTVYVYTYTPGSSNYAYFRSRTSGVTEIAAILKCVTLKWPWRVKCDFGSIVTVYVYTYTQGAQIKLIFALGQAVSEMAAIFKCDLEVTLKGQMWFWQHR